MACNCGRRRVIRQPTIPTTHADAAQQGEALIAANDVREIDMSHTDPATGTVRLSE